MAIPRANQAMSPILVDLHAVKKLEARVAEVAMVTPHKAYELMSAFNQGCLQVSEFRVFLEAELVKAEATLGQWRNHLLLDVVPKTLAAKDLASTKDHRDAVIELDEEYQRRRVVVEEIKAGIAWLKTKYDGFEMAYTATKKVFGDSHHEVPMNAPGDASGKIGAAPQPSGFGSPRF